jgi:lipopolysaccharide transport system permease protein
MLYHFIKELYAYREMLVSMVKRDLRGRYKGSMLGFLWTFINPLLQLIVYTLVFSNFMRMGIENYQLFLFVTLIPWMFFSNSILSSTTSILYNASLITKIFFPREIMPISVVTGNFINMLYCFVVVIAVVLFYHQNLNFICWLLLPIIAIIEYILTLGIAFIVSALTVYFRDLEHVMGISLLAWQFLTPVMYPETLVPNDYIKIFMLNPMTPITIAYRDILYYGAFPNWQTIAYALLCSISIFFVGLLIFEKMKRNFAEEL